MSCYYQSMWGPDKPYLGTRVFIQDFGFIIWVFGFIFWVWLASQKPELKLYFLKTQYPKPKFFRLSGYLS
jgi:hypothetical protein